MYAWQVVARVRARARVRSSRRPCWPDRDGESVITRRNNITAAGSVRRRLKHIHQLAKVAGCLHLLTKYRWIFDRIGFGKTLELETGAWSDGL